jgi:hypothetical protein
MIDFLIDTGAVFSAISEKEATLMGVDCSFLPESKEESIGFGGSFKKEHKIKYSSGFRVVCIPPNIESEEREKLLRYTPSVLGMDILAKFEIYINKDKVELTSNP